MFWSINSRLFSHVRRINDVKNLAHATLNWETVTQDSLYKRFHEIFMFYVDPTTKTLLDPDSAIHPFSMASKLESEDYPSFKEIMRMSVRTEQYSRVSLGGFAANLTAKIFQSERPLLFLGSTNQ